ncbi:hypothetical protein Patl1_11470 [Pistacia atlantica]|uniref:Uncharacterized protein n=1 Tax=Pistacia atlantica TaxID=434234 RepID=A0ACC1A4L5_9ROSI|nr:hypothetical protein Patl1_11470 [Pistacia atlantica]
MSRSGQPPDLKKYMDKKLQSKLSSMLFHFFFFNLILLLLFFWQ